MALYEEFAPRPNRLLDASSAYLRGAAYQPIGWFEYGPEAFAEAKQQGKPVLLDIGAAWCHWCHVIDEESYEDPAIATLINEHFIPIKVDRDERPDIDARYQAAMHLFNGQGGWPLTAFLTPEGELFYGGTYFPPEDRHHQVGMKKLLPRLADIFRHHRHELREIAHSLTSRAAPVYLAAANPAPVEDETFQQIARDIRAKFNEVQGGFEHGAPKFPHPGAVELALLAWDRTGEAAWREVATHTLTAMARGGIYDQLGGGFHRYSTDHNWIVPHFEKMSFDNALLLENYLHAFSATGEPLFREIAEGTLDFLLHTLTDGEHAGFFASQDADNAPGDDGSYWTWTTADLVALLTPPEAAVLAEYYGIKPEGNIPATRRTVLHLAHAPERIAERLERPREEVKALIASGQHKLRQARAQRKTPPVDRTLYTNWNALLISACLEAGVVLGHADAQDFALRTLDMLLASGYEPDHGMYHMVHTREGARLPGFLEDQVFTARALLDAFAVTGKTEYLDTARRLLDLCLEQYWDEEHGGFTDVARDRQEASGIPLLRLPRLTIEDMPTPAPNAVAAALLDRLGWLTHEARYTDAAARTLNTFAGHAVQFGPFAAYYGQAVYFHLHPPLQVTIIGAFDDPATRDLWATALQTYRPGRLVAAYPPSADAPSSRPLAYVCAGHQCAAPVSDAAELKKVMGVFGRE